MSQFDIQKPTVAPNIQMAFDESYDTDGAARYIGCSAGYLIKLRGTGDGPVFFRLFKRKGIRYWRRDIDAWTSVRRFESTSEYPETLR